MSAIRAAAAVVGAVVALGALTACQGPNRGTVHDKDFTPAHTTFTTVCSSSGKTTSCHPVPIYYGDEWDLDIYASKDDHGWREVTEHAYDSCAIGDYFDGRACR